jgi:hypothetical protein
MEQDNYAKFVGNLFIDGTKAALVTALLYVAARDYVNKDISIPQLNDSAKNTYFMASRGSEEISDIINSGFNNSSKIRK